jgi:hypothetical protein
LGPLVSVEDIKLARISVARVSIRSWVCDLLGEVEIRIPNQKTFFQGLIVRRNRPDGPNGEQGFRKASLYHLHRTHESGTVQRVKRACSAPQAEQYAGRQRLASPWPRRASQMRVPISRQARLHMCNKNGRAPTKGVPSRFLQPLHRSLSTPVLCMNTLSYTCTTGHRSITCFMLSHQTDDGAQSSCARALGRVDGNTWEQGRLGLVAYLVHGASWALMDNPILTCHDGSRRIALRPITLFPVQRTWSLTCRG